MFCYYVNQQKGKIMITNVSFGSTYKINDKNNDYDTLVQFQRFALNKEINDGIKIKSNTRQHSTQYLMIAPDYLDKEIETYFNCMGIKFKKLKNIK